MYIYFPKQKNKVKVVKWENDYHFYSYFILYFTSLSFSTHKFGL